MRPRQLIKRVILVSSLLVVVVGVCCAAFLYWASTQWLSNAELDYTTKDKLRNALSWRVQVYARKLRGEVPDFSWTEVWNSTLPHSGIYWPPGGGPLAKDVDIKGMRDLFQANCAGCHGTEGSGGPHGPSLARAGFKHGDSDASVYKVLRDGVRGTAMQPTNLSPQERWQMTAFVKRLQLRAPSDSDAKTSPALNIRVADDQLISSGSNPEEWLTYSGSYNGWRRSPLAEITPANVAHLRIHWVKQFETEDSMIEATPLLVGGAIFTVVPPATVVALDAKSGEEIWRLERSIPSELPFCCGRVNRGLAISGDTLFLGSLDGYLIAINANTGRMIWQTVVAKPDEGFTITAAPLVVGHSVVIGVSGGEFGIRGFLAAYDVSTGKQRWKFNTIPGPGEPGHETWKTDAWRTGGGPTWVTGSYDPSTGLLYWGVGNPAPDFSGDTRPGDNLYTNSVIALHADSEKLAWYFQFTPHDDHDWDSNQTPILADLMIDGKIRKAICWANRNGFYYVLDRVTGEFLSGTPFVELDWAKGLDSSGRPMLAAAEQSSKLGHLVRPGVAGGTNWQNPAFDDRRSLVFIPATEGASVFTKSASEPRRSGEQKGMFLGSGTASPSPATNVVRAIDASTGQRRWDYISQQPGRDFGGLLATEGGLVFGAAGGALFALDADNGRELWRIRLGGISKAAPISFKVDGRQIIAVTIGRALFAFGL